MIPFHNRYRRAAIGIFMPALVAFFPAHAAAQQRPISIDDWLRSERDNANMQRAVEQYEQAKYGTVTPQPTPVPNTPNTYVPQPAQPRNTYAPEQAQTPSTDAAPLAPVPGGELPQRPNQQNTYKVPDNALQKIDRSVDQYSASGPTDNGLYASAHAGWPFIAGSNYDFSSSGNIDADMSFLSFHLASAVGYKLDNGLSFELIGSYQNYSVDSLSSNSTSSGLTVTNDNVTGSVSMFSLLANAKMEFDINQGFSPYVMGGIGPGYHLINDVHGSGATSTLDDSAFVMAYQFGAGIMLPISNRSSLDFGYRYFGTTDADMNSAGSDFTADFSSHSMMIGYKHQL